MIRNIDESVGKVVKSLGDAKMLENSVIVFMSDNGAPTKIVPFPNYGSNYPLRGVRSFFFSPKNLIFFCAINTLILRHK